MASGIILEPDLISERGCVSPHETSRSNHQDRGAYGVLERSRRKYIQNGHQITIGALLRLIPQTGHNRAPGMNILIISDNGDLYGTLTDLEEREQTLRP